MTSRAPTTATPEQEHAAADYVEQERRAIQGEAPADAAKGPVFRSASSIAMALASVGERVPTTIATLNEATRGGIPSGKCIVVVGPPGSNKTGWATQEFLHQGQLGNAAGYLVADGDANDIVVRIGQQFGLRRDALEAAEPEALQELADRLEALPRLFIFDDGDGWTIEAAAEELHKRAEGKPTTLVVDSVQTVRCATSDTAYTRREQIDGTLRAIKWARKKFGHRVFAISEAGRAAYRSGDAANRPDDLAAGKETGGIEYGADVQIVLRSVKGEDDLFDATVPKNRLGQKTPFRLQLDFRRATSTEIRMPAEDATALAEQKRAAVQGDVLRDGRTLSGVVREQPGIGERELRAALRAAGHKWGRDRLDAAKRILASGIGGERLVDRAESRRETSWHLEQIEEGTNA